MNNNDISYNSIVDWLNEHRDFKIYSYDFGSFNFIDYLSLHRTNDIIEELKVMSEEGRLKQFKTMDELEEVLPSLASKLLELNKNLFLKNLDNKDLSFDTVLDDGSFVSVVDDKYVCFDNKLIVDLGQQGFEYITDLLNNITSYDKSFIDKEKNNSNTHNDKKILNYYKDKLTSYKNGDISIDNLTVDELYTLSSFLENDSVKTIVDVENKTKKVEISYNSK